MEKTFEIEVLERLAKIETKIDNYGETKKVAFDANTRSIQNEADIKEMKDNNKWIWRTIVGAALSNIITIVFLFIKFGMGVN